MKARLSGYKGILFLAIIIISLGVVISTTLGEHLGSLGIVFIAIGGLLFILGMKRKNSVEKDKFES